MKIKRPLLLPFSPIYGAVTWTRNKLFDFGLLKSEKFKVPVIAVGNLNVGGTGKTPHTIWVLSLISSKILTAVVSRGYGRKTQGYILANANSKGEEIGDEPKEILTQFPNIQLAVAEKRVEGISNLLALSNTPGAIVLDDAFQHRHVNAGLTILLSTQNEIFTEDIMLPGGNLRETKSGYKRADIIVITKCDKDLSIEQQKKIVSKINVLPHQKIGFSYFEYGNPINKNGEPLELPQRFVLLTGIAQTEYLTDYLMTHKCEFEHLSFKDHHSFSGKDYASIRKACEAMGTQTVLTTSKDFSRLKSSHKELSRLQILQLPIAVKFLSGGAEIESQILSFVLGKKAAI